MIVEEMIFSRSRRLLGDDVMDRLATARVIVFGVGGVGSWCAEALVRTGIRYLTIVDSDRVSVSNINRQLMATTRTVGHVKVDVLRKRLLEINPDAEIDARQQIFSAKTADSFHLDEYDYIIDAIDSLKDKVLLIDLATRTRAKLFSSMGAALKLDPTRIRTAEFWDVKGCPLARAIRQRFKRIQRRPARKFQCVFSDELLPNLGENVAEPKPSELCSEAHDIPGDPALAHHDWNESKAQINGSLVHITAIFGMTLSGLVIRDIYRKTNQQ